MKFKVLFPCNPLNKKEIDTDYTNELESIKLLNIDHILYDHDKLVKIDTNFINIEKSNEEILLVLRGYMLKEGQYHFLYNHLLNYNYKLINSIGEYLNCHYFTYSYPIIKEYSNQIWASEDYLSDNFLNEIVSLNKDLIIKDYVKSEKGTDLFKIDKDISIKELKDKIIKFKELRGNLFNKGIQFKEFLNLKKYGECLNEWRLFILNGELVSMRQNSNLIDDATKPNLPMLKEIIDKLSNVSNFLTFDIAEDAIGNFIVIETGDACVSGLSPNQNSFIFWSKIQQILN